LPVTLAGAYVADGSRQSHRAAQPIESLVDEDEWMGAAAHVHDLHARVHAVNSTDTQLAYVALARHGTIKPVDDERGPMVCRGAVLRCLCRHRSYRRGQHTETRHDRATINH